MNSNYSRSFTIEEAGPSSIFQRQVKSLTVTISLIHSSVETELRCELDSHADTCVAGANFYFLGGDGRTVRVTPFSNSLQSVPDIPIGTAATLYQDSTTGQQYILLFNEVLFFGDKLQGPSLLNPNQMRYNGLQVSDVPVQFDSNSTHSIRLPATVADAPEIPLTLRGVCSGFTTRKPTEEELNSLPHLEMTSPDTWHPWSAELAEKEQYTVESLENQRHINSITQLPDHDALNESRLLAAVKSYSDLCFGRPEFNFGGSDTHEPAIDRMVACVNASGDDIDGNGLSGFLNRDVYPEVYLQDRQRAVSSVLTDEQLEVFALSTNERRSVITPEILSQRWGIGLQTAKQTLKVTTQSGIRNVLAPSERKLRFRTNHMRFPTLRGRFYTDSMFSNTKSKRQHTGGQVFTDGAGYDRFIPFNSKADCPDCLMSFIQMDGIPKELVSDNAPAEFRGRWEEICKQYRIHRIQTIPGSPWQNRAEHSVRELKVAVRRALRRSRAPRRLWCYCAEWVTAIRRLTASNLTRLDGRTPEEHVLGSTPDISAYALFDWYKPVFYHDPVPTFPYQKKSIGYWIGIEECTVDVMASRILTSSGNVVIRKSVWAIPEDERKQPNIVADLAQLEADITSKLGDKLKEGDEDPEIADELKLPPNYIFDDPDGIEENEEPEEPDATKPEADDYTPEAYDHYLTAKVMLPHGGESARATVKARVKDADGVPIGKRNSNPLLDTRLYEVEFPDGSTDTFTANTIAENILSQVDEEGNTFEIIDSIVDHRSNGHAISREEGTFLDRRGKQHKKRTTRGWDLQVEMKDGSTAWLPLKDLKESHPVQVAEYAVANKIADEPAFAWWVRDVLRKRDRILAKVKSNRYWSKTHKFGIELPKTVEQALKIDRDTGTTFWQDAIEKEMKNVLPAFEFNDGDQVPIGYKHIKCHMVFDVKMDLTRKARLVAGGHMTDPPKESTYSSVVSRDSVRIAFTIAALNGLDVLAADVQNAYLNAPTKERVYTTAGLEFGADKVGRPVLIVRALYGLKSSGARWRDHMASSLREIGFESCKADPDVWMRPGVKANGDKYWEYVLCYVDDLLVVSIEPQKVMDALSEKYTLKKGSVKPPDSYLGADVKQYNIGGPEDSAKLKWAMSSDTYVARAVADVQRELSQCGQCLQKNVSTPMASGYRPELDATPLLDSKRANYFQGLIGVLRWICELGRIDILVDVAMMSRFLAAPRKGHLEQVLHIFAYLKRYDKSSMVFDDTMPVYDESRFSKCDWSENYPGAKEVIPPNAPAPRGKEVSTTCFVDADHAGCRVTRRSHTGIIIFLNKAPILWYSKRQNTVESSTFGSEFIAAKIAVEMVEGLRYKLRMMGIPLDGPTNFFCDNNSVVQNVSRPESVLKKKHCAIAYHRVREAQAAEIIRVAHEDGNSNIADIATKCLPGPRLRELIQYILW